MRNDKPLARALFTLLLFTSPIHAGQRPNLTHAIRSGEKFLINNVLSGNYALGCTSSGLGRDNLPCPYDGTGKVLTGYFIIQALQLGNQVPDSVRNTILTALDNDAKRIDADNFYWGDTNTLYWGYTNTTPPDSDDTSFAMQTLLTLGRNVDTSGLNEFYDEGTKAYTTFKYISGGTPSASPRTAQNNLDSPPETNANVFALLHSQHLDKKINFQLIKQFQNTAGYWDTYFYPGKYYSTYMNMRVLCQTKPGSKEVEKGLRFIFAAQNRNGSWGQPESSYDSALALNTLAACHQQQSTTAKRGVDFLIKAQNKEGYWMSDQAIWEYTPHPESSNPLRQTARDTHHVLVSALAVQALKQLKKS